MVDRRLEAVDVCELAIEGRFWGMTGGGREGGEAIINR